VRKVFASGNIAVAEAAMTAGLKFYAGYPITPSSDLMEYLAEELPRRGGVVIQMEDEIASINAIIGASNAGVKSMTATSGPGLSLMAEGIGLAVITETPIVIAHVMRAGPSTGVPTKTTQSDIFMVRWLTHGDYIIPSFAPWSVQEAFDLTIKAFNTSEKLRTPVFILSDAILAHVWEPLVVKEPGEVEIIERKTPRSKEGYMPYLPDEDLVPPMAPFGKGYKVLVESLVHDEKGYYAPNNEKYKQLVTRLNAKITRNIDWLFEYEGFFLDDADIVLVAYGSVARTVFALAKQLRSSGLRTGLFRPKTLWPLHEKVLRERLKGRKIIVVENNIGKLALDVERILCDKEVYKAPVLNLESPTLKEVKEAVMQWL
jgi:2-oxoglutarate ferredoxin oxidoreductase subunit alpha